jgi:hypothetical protein
MDGAGCAASGFGEFFESGIDGESYADNFCRL